LQPLILCSFQGGPLEPFGSQPAFDVKGQGPDRLDNRLGDKKRAWAQASASALFYLEPVVGLGFAQK
jgi:hypothetical protein